MHIAIRKDFDSLEAALLDVVAEMDEAQEVAESASADDEGDAWMQAIVESDKLLDEATKLLGTIEIAFRASQTYYEEHMQMCRDMVEYARVRNDETHKVEGPQGKDRYGSALMR